MAFHQHRLQRLPIIYSLTITTFCSIQQMKILKNDLKLMFNEYFFKHFLKNEKRESKTKQTSFFMLETSKANLDNSTTTSKSFSVKLSKEGKTSNFPPYILNL